MNAAQVKEAKLVVTEMIRDNEKAIDEHHERGFAMGQTTRRLQYVLSLLGGTCEAEIIEYREWVKGRKQ